MSQPLRPATRPAKQGLYRPEFEHDACGVGFVAHIKGKRSHQIVSDADHVLRRMEHRGACGCESNTGDGAGMLTALPHEFLRKVAASDLKTDLPAPGRFAAGVVFLPTADNQRKRCEHTVARIVAEQGQTLIGWRDVPHDPDEADIGPSARAAMPRIRQVFIGAADGLEGEAFERKLYMIRKRASHELRGSDMPQAALFYICSLSTKVMVYKGMLTPDQVMPFYCDLGDRDYASHLAMVHSRFSTNTFPSWDRAQPNRFMSHNGEINTLQGNKNWMFARQGVMKSEVFGEDLQKLFPVVEPDCSDSGTFDNALEFMLMSGRTLQEAVMMMVPEAWQNHETMDPAKRAFYEYHSCLTEPWDGPASIAFTDGKYIGACLDRNGLRPSRYYLTHDDRVIMASEVGVLPIEPQMIKEKGRLKPGRMFLVDFEEGRLIPDEELKSTFAGRKPYGQWVSEGRLELDQLPAVEPADAAEDASLERMALFGFTRETMQFMLLPLVQQKRDPVGSMGNDAALAVLSDKPRLLYDYFKQLFAQVTNPAIDSIREEVVMSLECCIGPEGNLLEPDASHARRLRLPHPILTDSQAATLKALDHEGWRTRTIDVTYPTSAIAGGNGHGRKALAETLDRICREAEEAIDAGCKLICLSDREAGPDRVPISALLACGAVHHHLVRCEKRTRAGLVIETGEAREVHHHALLVGYGADAINPYMAFAALRRARSEGELDAELADDQKLTAAYRKGVAKGLLKVMAKMGISTLASYKGAQIFEAVGLADEVIDRCFAGTASRIKGVDFAVLAEEQQRRHRAAYPRRKAAKPVHGLPNDGQFHWRAEGERHMYNPETISDLQQAARSGEPDAYQRFARLVDDDNRQRCTLRGLLQFKPADEIPLEEVEPASEIVKRFRTGAMSFGSISAEAHESLAIAMNRMGGKSNTGEGGEASERYQPMPNGDSKRSSIKQVASGRFGVTSWYLTNSDELQIKIAQGAKPGEGGELPGHKVDATIAATRKSTPGVGLISPPPHHDIYSIEDLAQLIHDLKNANRYGNVSVKLVSEVGVGTIAAGVTKAHADHILISGHDGGTGASPLTSIKHAGLPWELGIAETHQTLVMNDLRSRVSLETDGQLKTGRDVATAAILGAECFGFATAPLITLGCVMMRKCHLNTCPVGIATQDPELRKKFEGKPEHVVNYLFMVAEDARRWMAKLGVRSIDELVGRVDLLEPKLAADHWKARGVDLTDLLSPAPAPHPQTRVVKTIEQNHGLDEALDLKLLELCEPALKRREPVRVELPIRNIDRTVGTILSNEISRRFGEFGLPDETIRLRFTGSAGQSMGAFLQQGVTIELEGDANDYVGKGLSGGRIIVYPSRRSTFKAEENVLIGNVALYGATGGEAYFRGIAAERFCVRNSGASAVIEGIGDHGCEYMTGGRVVILGETGVNFAAGMSGGIAYVRDPQGKFLTRCNLGMVELDPLTEDDQAELRRLIENHVRYTGSTLGRSVLDDWERAAATFVKVFPTDYKRALAEGVAETAESSTKADRPLAVLGQ